MSKHYNTMIQCPKCNKKSSFTIWDSVNTTLDPEMKQKVKDRSAFTFICPNCGEKTGVDYGFLYHDMDNQLMIAYAPTDDNFEQIYKEFTDKEHGAFGFVGSISSIGEMQYLLRIVRSQNQLREKILIFEDKLDDRIVEIYKLFLFTNMSDEITDDETLEIFYFREENPRFDVVSGRGLIGTFDFDLEFYNSISKTFGTSLPETREDDPIIDRHYAFRIVSGRK